jgi:hypothetical protein
MNKTHLITAWSGDHKDESPLCGADKYDENVWGFRTENREFVTCEKCLEAAPRKRKGKKAAQPSLDSEEGLTAEGARAEAAEDYS